MKKLSMVLAVVGLLVSTSVNAQLTKKPDNTRGTRTVIEEVDKKPKLYGTMMSYVQGGRAVVKIEFDPMVERITPDKTSAGACYELERYRFNSLGEALNVLSSHGWVAEFGWTTEEARNGTVTHFVLSKEVEKLMPVYPWKEKKGGDSIKEGAKTSGKSKR